MYRHQSRAAMMGSLSGTIFFIGLLIAIFSGNFLPIFFVALGLSAFVGSLSANNVHAAVGGLQGFVFFFGLAVIAATDFWWPGIAVVLIICAILGSLHLPLTTFLAGILGSSNQSYQSPPQPYYQPSLQPYQPSLQPYQPYQEGYQAIPLPEVCQESGKQYQYPPLSQSNYEMPQAQYPPQEMPPQ